MCASDLTGLTHVVEGCTVPEHQQHVVHKLLGCKVMQRVAPVQLLADQRQVDRLLDDLVVVSSLWRKPTWEQIVNTETQGPAVGKQK